MLKDFRVKAGLSQQQLAEKLGWMGAAGQRKISHIEHRSSTPKLEHCRLIVDALNETGVTCTLDDVFPPAPAEQDVA